MDLYTVDKLTPRLFVPIVEAASLGPDLPGFSGADEGVHACSVDSIATKILGFQT